MAEQKARIEITSNTPEPIAALLRASKDFDASAARQEYTDWSPAWNLYRDLAEMDPTKLPDLVVKHADEGDPKYNLRKSLAIAFNLVPSILNMMTSYLFEQDPTIDVGGDEDLGRFTKDCTGTGVPLLTFLRQKALPMAMTYGWVDCLVQNPWLGLPEGSAPASPLSGADAGKVVPAVTAFAPIARRNWSVRTNGEYNWARFRDVSHETVDPFVNTPVQEEGYLTISAALPGKIENAFWLRSVRRIEASGGGGGGGGQTVWVHEGGECPGATPPIATLTYQASNDPDRPHFGISKIAIIASLTKYIIQVLSWTSEDVLANLGVICMPSKNGLPPQQLDASGQPTGEPVNASQLNAFTIVWYDREASTSPHMMQGETSHIEVKLKLVDAVLREIRRIAHIDAAEASPTMTTSGISGVVQRNELFKELGDLAVSLTAFTYDLLATAKSWLSDKEVTVEEIQKAGVRVSFSRGPYILDPLSDMLANAEKIVALYARYSPSMVLSYLRTTALAAMQSEDPNRTDVLKELESTVVASVEEDQAAADKLREAGRVAAEATIAGETEPVPGGEGGEDTAGRAATVETAGGAAA